MITATVAFDTALFYFFFFFRIDYIFIFCSYLFYNFPSKILFELSLMYEKRINALESDIRTPYASCDFKMTSEYKLPYCNNDNNNRNINSNNNS